MKIIDKKKWEFRKSRDIFVLVTTLFPESRIMNDL